MSATRPSLLTSVFGLGVSAAALIGGAGDESLSKMSISVP